MSSKPSPAAALKHLRTLIRIGLPLSPLSSVAGRPRTLEQHIREAMKPLKRLDQPGPRDAVADILQYKALRAEFEYSFGREDEGGAEALAAYLDSHPLRLMARLDAWSPEQSTLRDAGDTAEILRQKLWALMAVAFYRDYATRGDVKAAVSSLERIRKVIDEELTPLEREELSPIGKRRPHGTLAKVHELLAQCYRTLGRFAQAEMHFLEAQKQADSRLAREMRLYDTDVDRRRDAYQFSIISTARVLGGLGRVSMLQGRLRRAEVILHSAQTLLRPSGQESLKLVVSSLLAITKRRLCPPLSGRWQRSLDRLAALYAQFAGDADLETIPGSRDNDGSRRCAQELAWAYLDEAESHPLRARDASLQRASLWIDRLDALAPPGHADDSVERFRVLLLRTCLETLKSDPDFDLADQSLARARRLLRRNPNCQLDLMGFDRMEMRLAEGIVLAARARMGKVAIDTVAQFFRALVDSAHGRGDRVLESEVILRWAVAEAEAGREERAQEQLAIWKRYAPFIDNASLHELHRVAATAIHIPTLAFPTLHWDENIERVEDLLFERAMFQSGGDESQAREILGVTRERYTTIKKRRASRAPGQDKEVK